MEIDTVLEGVFERALLVLQEEMVGHRSNKRFDEAQVCALDCAAIGMLGIAQATNHKLTLDLYDSLEYNVQELLIDCIETDEERDAFDEIFPERG